MLEGRIMKNKISIIIIIFITLCFLNACVTNDSKHTITYYSDGQIIEHEPSYYLEGQTTVLLPIEKEGYEFIGWYDSMESTSKKVDIIDKDAKTDYVLYAKWEKIISPEPKNDLEKAIQNMYDYSYSFSYSSFDSDEEYICNYEVCGNNLKSIYESLYGTTIEYLALDDEMYYYYGENLDGTFYYIPETDPYFYDYAGYLDVIYLDALNPDLFELKDNAYCLKDSNKTHEVVSEFIGLTENEEFKDIQIIVVDNAIKNILINSIYTYDGIEYEYNYEIVFSNNHEISFKLPDATKLKTTMTVEEVVASSDGESVSTIGYITGMVGNNFYISDETGSLYIYAGNMSFDELSIGMEVMVSGTKETYKGLVEVSNIQDIVTTGNINEKLTPLQIEDVSENTLNKHLCSLVTTPYLNKISGTIDFNKDSSLIFSDGVNQVVVFISKYLSTSIKQTIKDILDSSSSDNQIVFDYAIVGCFNTPQITITENTKISNSPQEIVEVGITSNLKTLNVLVNTTFEEAIKPLVVSVVKSNGNKSEIDLSDCELNYTYDSSVEGIYSVIITYHDFETTINIVVSKEPQELKKLPDSTQKLEDVTSVFGITRGIPNIGNPRILVIPVAFTDYPAPSNMCSVLQTSFFGTSTETGWESLQSYYYKTSYGKLNIEGTVLPVFNTGKKSTYYDSLENADSDILAAALKYYDSQINYAEYDTDKDGYIDGIYLVYTAEIDYYSDTSVWWAFTTEYFTDEAEYYDGVEADYYLFAGYDFIFEDLASGYNVTYNMETFIHETGHMLGLDDYYDFDSSYGPIGGIGGGDMMDANVGDHNAYSKAILGWVNPLLMEGSSATVTLGSFGKTGDCIIIGKNFNGSYFDEYFIIDFYTPDGLNEVEKGNSGLFSKSGIRIYHIDARLTTSEVASVWEVCASNNGSTSHKLIELVEADRGNNISNGQSSSNTDLFQVGSTFSWGKWYDGTSAGFTLNVISISDTEATITITY